jgi:Type I restriction modification DNA specificity domain
LLPTKSSIPKWVYAINCSDINLPEKSFSNEVLVPLNVSNWKSFKYKDLFDIERGRGPRKKELSGEGNTPFVSASEFNNGLTGWTNNLAIHKGEVISVVRNGNSVANAFYQIEPFCSTEDVHIFSPKFKINKAIALFICTLIKKEAYRFSYGRKWGIERMKESVIWLPVNENNEPDYLFMEKYIKGLPYSSQIF